MFVATNDRLDANTLQEPQKPRAASSPSNLAAQAVHNLSFFERGINVCIIKFLLTALISSLWQKSRS